jgi:cytochrome P450
MLSQIRWHQPNAEINPFEYLNFARWYIHWRNGRQMDRYIGNELDKRYREYKADPANPRTKAVIDLVLQAYTSQDTKPLSEKLDPTFRLFAIRQIRLFVFAGHDSTSSTICYIFYLLAKNPEALSRLRAEHDTVLGADPSAAQALLASQPQLTNSLLYTNAVTKEALRLFTPAGCSRAGKPNVSLTNDEGNQCPTADAMVWMVHVEMHRSPKYWVRPDEFIPERWLVEAGHELYPMKGAWRSFEHGPRNCIAQGLVMTEMSVVLAMVAREFDIQPAYDEWDRLHPRKGLKTYRGERAYQIEEGAAHPVNKYPCRVSLRNI